MVWEPPVLADARTGLEMLDVISPSDAAASDMSPDETRDVLRMITTTAAVTQAYAMVALVEAVCTYGDSIITRLEKIAERIDMTMPVQ